MVYTKPCWRTQNGNPSLSIGAGFGKAAPRTLRSLIRNKFVTTPPLGNPCWRLQGSRFVYVNGSLALEHGQLTDQFGGQPIRRLQPDRADKVEHNRPLPTMIRCDPSSSLS